jgi:hypothetical protein
MGVCCTRDENTVYSYDFEHYWIHKVYQTNDSTLWSVYPLQLNVLIETFYLRKDSTLKIKLGSEPYTIDFKNMLHTSDIDSNKKTNIRRVNKNDITIKIFRQQRNTNGLFILKDSYAKGENDLFADLTDFCNENIHVSLPFMNNTITGDNIERFFACRTGLLNPKFKNYKSIEKVQKALKKTVNLVCQDEEIQRNCYFNEINSINARHLFLQIVRLYTMEGSLYERLNDELRTKDKDLSRPIELYFILLQNAIVELSKIQKEKLRTKLALTNEGTFQLYRGCSLSKEVLARYQSGEGKLKFFNEFLSTTYDHSNAVLNATSQANKQLQPCVFVFNIPFDKKCFAFIEDISYYSVEREVLLTAGCLFRVKGATLENNINKIQLELISDGTLKYDYLSYTGVKEARIACAKEAENDRFMIPYIIKYHREITKLTLRQCWLTDKHMPLICEALRYNTTLKDLDLSYNQMTDAVTKDFERVFKFNKGLEKINLSQNKFTIKFVEQTLDELKANSTLRDIILYAIKLEERGAKLIADLLANNKTLRSVDINQTAIGDAGVTAICEAIKDSNSTLEELSIRKNGISDTGIENIAELSRKTKSLRFIDCGENKVTKFGATKIAEALRENRSLYSISLDRTEIGEEGAKEIIDVILKGENESLKEIYLAENNLDESIVPKGIKDVRIKLKKEY